MTAITSARRAWERRGGRVWRFCGRRGILGVILLGAIEDSDSAVPSRIRSLDASSERTPIGDGRARRSSYGRPRCTSFVLSCSSFFNGRTPNAAAEWLDWSRFGRSSGGHPKRPQPGRSTEGEVATDYLEVGYESTSDWGCLTQARVGVGQA